MKRSLLSKDLLNQTEFIVESKVSVSFICASWHQTNLEDWPSEDSEVEPKTLFS